MDDPTEQSDHTENANNNNRKVFEVSEQVMLSSENIREDKAVGSSSYSKIINIPLNATPDRVFKIVFIGDSGVGKTSFVQRFCNDSFRESFNTTIGVDFQVKLLSIDGRIIALQLWDTVR